MAELYISNSKGAIVQSIFDMYEVMSTLQSLNIVLRKYKSLSKTNINETCELESYRAWDIIDSQPLDFDIHYHRGPEARIIIKGNVVFKIPRENVTYELHMGPGEGVTLPDHLLHSFQSVNPFTAVRFFSTVDQHTMYHPE